MRFGQKDLQKLWKPKKESNGEDNGQITIIGGSELFTGAPLLSLVAASRLVDMVFLVTPKEDKNIVNKMKLFKRTRCVIWVPREDVDEYIAKSDTVLIGPGMMRYRKIIGDDGGDETKKLTRELLQKFPHKQWVIDGGSLQILDPDWIPENAILTPNKKEYQMVFGDMDIKKAAQKHKCIIVYKGPVAIATDGKTTYEVMGGNAGLTKGGTGDVLAGVIAGLLTKNPPLLAAAAGTYLLKKTAEKLFLQKWYWYNADDVAESIAIPA